MKRAFAVMVVSALLVTLGFAQTPDPGSNTNQANVKGCLAGSDGNYTVMENGTRQIFKITTSSVDLKPHVGHDVKLTGQKATEGEGSRATDSSFAVTDLNMISEHCAAAATASVVTVVPSSETVIAPGPDAASPAVTVSPSSSTVSTPGRDAAPPAVTVSPSSSTVSTPAANAAHAARQSAHPRRLAATQAAAATAPAEPKVSPSSETVRHTAADAATPGTTARSSSETASAPAAAATTPTVTHRAGALSLLISFVVLVIVLGTLTPLLLRWRKRKMLERTGAPNLSFTNEVSSEQDRPEARKVA